MLSSDHHYGLARSVLCCICLSFLSGDLKTCQCIGFSKNDSWARLLHTCLLLFWVIVNERLLYRVKMQLGESL